MMPAPFTPAAGQLGNMAGVASGCTPPPGSDAELFAVCAAFNALDDERRRLVDNPSVDDDQATAISQPIFDKMDVLLDRMDVLRASTAAGIHTRAHCLALYNGDFIFSFDYRDTKTGRLLDYLLRDAAALASSSAAGPEASL